jgi:hypothetical protein
MSIKIAVAVKDVSFREECLSYRYVVLAEKLSVGTHEVPLAHRSQNLFGRSIRMFWSSFSSRLPEAMAPEDTMAISLPCHGAGLSTPANLT